MPQVLNSKMFRTDIKICRDGQLFPANSMKRKILTRPLTQRKLYMFPMSTIPFFTGRIIYYLRYAGLHMAFLPAALAEAGLELPIKVMNLVTNFNSAFMERDMTSLIQCKVGGQVNPN